MHWGPLRLTLWTLGSKLLAVLCELATVAQWPGDGRPCGSIVRGLSIAHLEVVYSLEVFMFCSACGAEIQPQFTVCPKCRRPLAPASAAIPPSRRLDRHIGILGTLWLIAGALFAIPGLVLTTMSKIVRIAVPSTETVGRFVAPLVLSIIGFTLLIIAAGGILVGLGLRSRHPWARTAAIVLGIFSLFHPPLGTALGIYTLWVLLSDQGGAEYYHLTRTA